MKELLQKAKFNNQKIKATVTRAVAYNLSELSKPCYYPEVKKHFYEFLNYTGLSEDDVRRFSKRRWAGRKEAKFAIQSDHIANFYIFMMQYYLNVERDLKTYRYFMVFYMIRHYANLMKKHFKYCKPEHFNYALETLTKTHLFSREKTIANALYFLAEAMVRIWTKGIAANNLDQISRFMQDSRTRVSQSMKSFASAYYRAEKEGAGIQASEIPSDDDDESYEYEVKERPTKLIDKNVRNMTVYKVVNKKAMEDARKISKINTLFADALVKSLGNVKFSDNIRIIYQLFLKDIPNVSTLCGPNFLKYVRSLMAIKRTMAKVYFKQQVEILLMQLLKEANMRARYDRLTSQTKFLINLFLAYYLTMYLRNSVC
jgi:hypothetical protein